MARQKRHEDPIRILAVVPKEDHALLEEMLGWEYECLFVKTFTEAWTRLQERLIPVVLYEQGFADITWERALRRTQQLEHAPHFIVVHKNMHHRLLAKVLNFGGYDILRKPIEEEEWKYVITLAAKSRLGIP